MYRRNVWKQIVYIIQYVARKYIYSGRVVTCRSCYLLLHFHIIHDNKSTISRDSNLLLLSKHRKHCACLFYTDGYASIKSPNISVTKFHNLDIITFHFYNFWSWLIRFEPKIYLQIILQIRIIFSKFSHSTKFNMLSMQFLPRTIDEV